MRSITNDYKACEVWNLASHGDERGPFLIVQFGDAPHDERLRDQMFLLRKDGQWVESDYYAALGWPATVEEAVYSDIDEVVRALAGLGPRVEVANVEVDEAGLQRWLANTPSGSMLEQFRLWVEQYNQRRKTPGEASN